MLSPIFEADLAAVSAAVEMRTTIRRVHRLLTTGHREVDLSDSSARYRTRTDEVHARRVSDGRSGRVKAWLEMAVEEDAGRGRRRTNPARRELEGDPARVTRFRRVQNRYMLRRFIFGWIRASAEIDQLRGRLRGARPRRRQRRLAAVEDR